MLGVDFRRCRTCERDWLPFLGFAMIAEITQREEQTCKKGDVMLFGPEVCDLRLVKK